MLHLFDILHKVACELHGYSGLDPEGAIQELFDGQTYRFTLAITDDVEESELDFLTRYGQGATFYFRLRDYEEGKTLAGSLHHFFTGKEPTPDANSSHFEKGKQLYLFLHVRDAALASALQ